MYPNTGRAVRVANKEACFGREGCYGSYRGGWVACLGCFGRKGAGGVYKAADVCVADERLRSEVGQITRAHEAAAGAGSARPDRQWEPGRGDNGDPAPPGRN